MLYHPLSYGITIDENPIPLKSILCLLLIKVLFETSSRSFQYDTKDRRQIIQSNYYIVVYCVHIIAQGKRGCVKKYLFGQYAKGGHFCSAHTTLRLSVL